MQTRWGVPSWNLGGSSMRAALQAAQKIPPHSLQWCRALRSDLQRQATSGGLSEGLVMHSNNPAAQPAVVPCHPQ